MNFWQAFGRALPRRPVAALAALYWHVTRRRVRARNRLRLTAAQSPNAYQYWIEQVEDLTTLRALSGATIARWKHKPRFSLLLRPPADCPMAEIKRLIASLDAQFYQQWELLIISTAEHAPTMRGSRDKRVRLVRPATALPGEALKAAIAEATGDLCVPLALGQSLSPAALFRLAEAVQDKPDASILYGDEDRLLAGRRSRPWFKPQWDEEMFLAQDYLSSACAVDLALATEVASELRDAGEAAEGDFLLRAARAAPGPIVHVPHILAHVPLAAILASQPERSAAVANFLAPEAAAAIPGAFGSVRVVWPLPSPPPTVAIIIPTRDEAALLKACVESVLTATRYPRFELIVVDNGSSTPEALAYLSHLDSLANVRVLRYDHPYNYSAINNFAAAHATAPYMCLLNNDTEVVEPEWLTEMMRYAVRPDVGAVGAMLLYDDGTIQHAGVVIGICEAAGHAHRFERRDAAGYFAQPHIARRVSAVTAACLVVERAKFEAVGGLDEDGLAIAYNDVDLCLKLDQAGWRNIYVPHAVLIHHESKSRGQDMAPANIERYRRELAVLQERWGTRTYADPRFNPNLDRYSETFILRV
ncbi:MAG: glycosyltransferase family 2 protein [Sphingomicrobium sp.]